MPHCCSALKYTELIFFFFLTIRTHFLHNWNALFSPLLCKHGTFLPHHLQMIHKMILQTFKEILQEKYKDLHIQSKYTSRVNSLWLWNVFIHYVIYRKKINSIQTHVTILSALSEKNPTQKLVLLKDDLTFVLKWRTQASLIPPAERTFITECLNPASMHYDISLKIFWLSVVFLAYFIHNMLV